MVRNVTKKKAAAKKKTAPKKKTSKALMTISDLKKARRRDTGPREAEAGGDYISIRNGKFTFKGANLGTQIDVVILDYAFLRNWYDQDFDADDPVIPACYAISLDEVGIEPAENSVMLQCEGECNECEFDAWGSADKGDGKACKEMRRLACLSADDDLAKAEIGFMNIPSASLKNWKSQIASPIERKLGAEVVEFIIRISFDPEEDFVKLNFEIIEEIKDAGELAIAYDKREECAEKLIEGFDPEQYHAPAPKRKPKSKTKSSRGAKATRAPAKKKRATRK